MLGQPCIMPMYFILLMILFPGDFFPQVSHDYTRASSTGKTKFYEHYIKLKGITLICSSYSMYIRHNPGFCWFYFIPAPYWLLALGTESEGVLVEIDPLQEDNTS